MIVYGRDFIADVDVVTISSSGLSVVLKGKSFYKKIPCDSAELALVLFKSIKQQIKENGKIKM